jgi:chromosome segregation ATPase
MEWSEGRLTKNSVDAREVLAERHTITEAFIVDKPDLPSARERILELAPAHQQSGSRFENLRAELSVCYAAIRGVRQELEAEIEANGKLSAELKNEVERNKRLEVENDRLSTAVAHESKNTEKLNALLGHEREENDRLNVALECARLENANLVELTRSLREQADGLDGLRAVLEVIAEGRMSPPLTAQVSHSARTT